MTSNQYKKSRQKLGTQKEVAELLGVTRQLIGMRGSGEAKITKEAVLAIRFLSLN